MEKPTYPIFIKSFRLIMMDEKHISGNLKDVIERTSLGQNIDVEIKNGLYRSGKSENHFGSYLLSWFDNLIYKNIGVYSPNLKINFAPDFLLYDRVTNFHLGIEIDEPYVYETKEPIHWISNNWASENLVAQVYCDDSEAFTKEIRGKWNEIIDIDVFFRTDEIIKRGWFMVKFSEKQVILYPNECCKYIADEIFKVIGVDFSKKNRMDYQKLEEDTMWTDDDATRMAEENYRDDYINLIENKNIKFSTFNEYKLSGKKWWDLKERRDELEKNDFLPF